MQKRPTAARQARALLWNRGERRELDFEQSRVQSGLGQRSSAYPILLLRVVQTQDGDSSGEDRVSSKPALLE